MRQAAAAAGAGLVLLLASCAAAPEDIEPAPTPSVAEPPPAAAPAPETPPPAPPRDACGAAELQGLIGHPRTEIPVPVHPERQRVACTTCPITQDYNPARLNFLYDAQTGMIREIKCG